MCWQSIKGSKNTVRYGICMDKTIPSHVDDVVVKVKGVIVFFSFYPKAFRDRVCRVANVSLTSMQVPAPK
jgi:hypothetical protein